MKRIEYKVVTGTGGLLELETKMDDLLNNGWRTVGGIAFNQGFAYQAVAKIHNGEAKTQKETKEDKKSRKNASLDNNQAMKALDGLL